MNWQKKKMSMGAATLMGLFFASGALSAFSKKEVAANVQAMLDGGRAMNFGIYAAILGAVAGAITGMVILAKRD